MLSAASHMQGQKSSGVQKSEADCASVWMVRHNIVPAVVSKGPQASLTRNGNESQLGSTNTGRWKDKILPSMIVMTFCL